MSEGDRVEDKIRNELEAFMVQWGLIPNVLMIDRNALSYLRAKYSWMLCKYDPNGENETFQDMRIVETTVPMIKVAFENITVDDLKPGMNRLVNGVSFYKS